jgi:hypothetical protein
MHLPRGFALCCLFSFEALGLVRATPPDFGSNVKIFDPSMPISEIQKVVDEISGKPNKPGRPAQPGQLSNEFGTKRYALLFMPGTYGTPGAPLNFYVGYYTAVAGLGLSPNDVVVNGSIDVPNQCKVKDGITTDNCKGLRTFWRSLSNVKINVTNGKDCNNQNREVWAVSQAAPMRRVHINGFITLTDNCSQPGYVSGGFIADSEFDGVDNGQQQQWLIRNSKVVSWSGGVWNQLFSGVVGAPAQNFPDGGAFTTLATSPVTREAPYLYVDDDGHYWVFVPSLQRNSVGTDWGSGSAPGSSISIDDFFIAKPPTDPAADSAPMINNALAQGKNLILTPGIYQLKSTIQVTRQDTVVLGLGFPTLVPKGGVDAMSVADVPGVVLSGLLFDAGPKNSQVLLRVGTPGSHQSDPQDPTFLSDVFFRIGGATAGKATISLIVNSDHVILDDIWAWRADHGTGVGWTDNTADTGVIVDGGPVVAYGLFVEHYQKYEVIWNGKTGTVIFFQNEMPYDVPKQGDWMEAPKVDGWAAFKIADHVTDFEGYGMGSYSIFETTIDKPDNTIYAENAFEVPDSLPAASLNDLLTVCLSDKVHGGIRHVINGKGEKSNEANSGHAVHVVSYP